MVPILDENDDVEFLDCKLTFVSVTGSTEEWLAVSTFEVAKGSFITAADNEARSKTVAIGADIADTLFPHSEPVGSTIRVAGKLFTVVVLGRKGKASD